MAVAKTEARPGKSATAPEQHVKMSSECERILA